MNKEDAGEDVGRRRWKARCCKWPAVAVTAAATATVPGLPVPPTPADVGTLSAGNLAPSLLHGLERERGDEIRGPKHF